MHKVATGESTDFPIVNPNVAGIDIGAEESYVAVPENRCSESIRSYGMVTCDLYAIADWLDQCGIDSVAMESTGVYWIPLFQILEARGFDVCLVNARHAKNVPGRKTDVVDCRWLQRLHTYGLLAASFRPPDEICVLRSYWRQRDMLVRSSGDHIRRMQKALTQMNVLLHNVVSDITGVTGMAIIEAIIGGERDCRKLATLRNYRCKKSEHEIATALDGDYRTEHIFSLKQAIDSWNHCLSQIGECDGKINDQMGTLNANTDQEFNGQPPKISQAKRHNPPPALAEQLYRITGVDLTAITGIEVTTALTVVSEIGTDVSLWPSLRHFTSWLGLCPCNKISGGKVLAVKTRKVVNRVSTALRIAAMTLKFSQTPLGAFYRRMQAKIGPSAAITATAHKLARIIYTMLKYRQPYDPERLNQGKEQTQKRAIAALKKRARNLGFQIIPVEPDMVAVS
ncbi:MAG: IS110 family transposase [Proteobacteria bacterium]|nr:IS110 family transposase [Pseudomonadota bacterium]